jgi:hypothetical protein
MAFPPDLVYPYSYDSDHTLYKVYNTTESKLSSDNQAWASEIDIVPVTTYEVWPNSGFATLEGEIIYYDSVAKNDAGFVIKLRRCGRNLGGNKTRFNVAGTWIRGFVMAEHHNKIVDAIINLEDYVLSLDEMIAGLQNEPICIDDGGCTSVNFDFETSLPNACLGVDAIYNVNITGNYTTAKVDFGDGNTTNVLSGTHTYSQNSTIDPVVTVENALCTVIQTETDRDDTNNWTPYSPPPQSPYIETCQIPDIPPFVIPTFVPPTGFATPQITSPCIDFTPFNFALSIPKILISIPSIKFPNIKLIVPSIPNISMIVPSIPNISLIVPSIMPISFIGSFSGYLPSIISFGPVNIPSVIEFGPVNIPTIIPIIAPLGWAAPPWNINMIAPPNWQWKITIDGPVPPLPNPIQIQGPEPKIPSVITVQGNIVSVISIVGCSLTNISVVGLRDITMSVVGLSNTTMQVVGLSNTTMQVVGLSNTTIQVIGLSNTTISVIGLRDTTMSVVGLRDTIMQVVGLRDTIMSVVGLSNAIISAVGLDGHSISVTGMPATIAVTGMPSALTVNWGVVPSINVNWGSCSCAITVSCANTPAPAPAPFTNLADFSDGLNLNASLESNEIGIPSEITVLFPEELPKFQIEIPKIPDIVMRLEKPLPTEIKITGVPESIRLDTTNMPNSIKLDATSLPEAIYLIAQDVPSIITVDGSDIPRTIKVEGIPQVIELKAPDSIALRLPENFEIPLVFKGDPIPVRFDISNFNGTASESPRFVILPAPCPQA